MKLHAGSQMEDVRQWVGHLPLFREFRVHVPLLVDFQKAAEDKTVNFLRLCIRADPRIEIGRHRLDQEVHNAGFSAYAARAAGEERSEE